MKKKEYPSQKRYRTNNPAITFRLKRQDKERLDTIVKATGKPISKWLFDFINDKIDTQGEISKLVIRIHELEEKNKELANERRFNVPCSICGKPIYFSSKLSIWNPKVYPILKQAFSTWYHSTCKPK